MPTWQRKWQLNDGPENVYAPDCMLELIEDTSGTIDFFTDPGEKIKCFTVKRTDAAPPWTKTWLVQRGRAELAWDGRPLKSWDPTREYTYDKRINRALRFADANTLRLEGEIEVGGKKELVIFFVAPKAAERLDGSLDDVLVIRSRMKSLLDIGVSQDGTAHGNPR